jgi:glycosyltransferase involved in cell wall biosynthesis
MSAGSELPRGADRRLLFFGGYDPSYPRNAIIRKGWLKCGLSLAECRVDSRLKVHLRYPALLWRYLRMRDPARVIFVPDFRHKDVPLAWALARLGARRLVFDPLVSRYETRVLDREDAARGSPQAAHNRNIDRLSMALPDVVLADTEAHADYYRQELSVPAGKLRVLPVGFDEELFRPAPLPPPGPALRVLFYGTYLPLHGVETIVEAAAILRGPSISFTLVGEGQTLARVKEKAAARAAGTIVFRAPVPPARLAGVIEESDVVLGVFGTTPKTGRVVPNKVFQALAVGRPVVTADTPAIRELFERNVHLATVPAGDARSLAGVLEKLAADRAFGRELAETGGAYVRAEFNSRRIAERLLGILEEERPA